MKNNWLLLAGFVISAALAMGAWRESQIILGEQQKRTEIIAQMAHALERIAILEGQLEGRTGFMEDVVDSIEHRTKYRWQSLQMKQFADAMRDGNKEKGIYVPVIKVERDKTTIDIPE